MVDLELQFSSFKFEVKKFIDWNILRNDISFNKCFRDHNILYVTGTSQGRTLPVVDLKHEKLLQLFNRQTPEFSVIQNVNMWYISIHVMQHHMKLLLLYI